MSFFGRTFIALALFAGAAHVFRRDITRIVGVLRKPTENFIKEVKHEIDTTSTANGQKVAGVLGGKVAEATGATVTSNAAKAAAAADAASQVSASSSSDSAKKKDEQPQQ